MGVPRTLVVVFVNSAVDLDGETMSSAVEVDHETPDHLLPSEPQAVATAISKELPDALLRRRSSLSQASRQLPLVRRDASSVRDGVPMPVSHALVVDTTAPKLRRASRFELPPLPSGRGGRGGEVRRPPAPVDS